MKNRIAQALIATAISVAAAVSVAVGVSVAAGAQAGVAASAGSHPHASALTLAKPPSVPGQVPTALRAVSSDQFNCRNQDGVRAYANLEFVQAENGYTGGDYGMLRAAASGILGVHLL